MLNALPLSNGDVSGLLDLAPVLAELDDGRGLDTVEDAVREVDVELTRVCVRGSDLGDVLTADRSASIDAVDSLNIHWNSCDAIWKDIADDILADCNTRYDGNVNVNVSVNNNTTKVTCADS